MLSTKKKQKQPKALSFGDALSHLMKMREVTDSELAILLDVPFSVVQAWLCDWVPVDKDQATEIAEALDVDPRMLWVTLKEPKP